MVLLNKLRTWKEPTAEQVDDAVAALKKVGCDGLTVEQKRIIDYWAKLEL